MRVWLTIWLSDLSSHGGFEMMRRLLTSLERVSLGIASSCYTESCSAIVLNLWATGDLLGPYFPYRLNLELCLDAEENWLGELSKALEVICASIIFEGL